MGTERRWRISVMGIFSGRSETFERLMGLGGEGEQATLMGS